MTHLSICSNYNHDNEVLSRVSHKKMHEKCHEESDTKARKCLEMSKLSLRVSYKSFSSFTQTVILSLHRNYHRKCYSKSHTITLKLSSKVSFTMSARVYCIHVQSINTVLAFLKIICDMNNLLVIIHITFHLYRQEVIHFLQWHEQSSVHFHSGPFFRQKHLVATTGAMHPALVLQPHWISSLHAFEACWSEV